MNRTDSSAIDRLPRMLPEERTASLLCHLSTAIPLWALVSNAAIYFLYREKSRAVCFHARQGINFQVLLLAIVVVKRLADMLARILAIVARRIAVSELVEQVGDSVLLSVFIVYVSFCLIGAIQAVRGRVLPYPFVSASALREYVRATRMGGEA